MQGKPMHSGVVAWDSASCLTKCRFSTLRYSIKSRAEVDEIFGYNPLVDFQKSTIVLLGVDAELFGTFFVLGVVGNSFMSYPSIV